MSEPAYFISEPATADLNEIRDFSLEQFGVDKTIALLERIYGGMNRIARNPDKGWSAWRFTDRPIRYIDTRPYLIFYDPASRPIVILRVLYPTRDLKTDLED